MNNILYIVSTPTCFSASASSSGSLNLVFCYSYNIIQIANTSIQKTPIKDCPDCVCSHQTTTSTCY